ncbi:37156_t:CDS:2 [Gigaspora margarita]|uniref:37156_t:CDS:1 n=1 Tax=Gigaspora margarita TaxID=4874 RepID=A0ABN7VWL0_GIGMA|nr:37156_t:CDS:2 [Gigaspora margarita]
MPNLTKYVTPGRRLCFSEGVTAGPGVYERGEYLYASVVGVVQELAPTTEGEPRVVTVTREKVHSAVPDVGSIITGKVIRMTTKEAVVSIMVVGNMPCKDDFQGDARSYYLSTAKNELGVIYAQSVAGAVMIPISWQEMQCTKTKAMEPRKCAKPDIPLPEK